jgi:hypothetical protein
VGRGVTGLLGDHPTAEGDRTGDLTLAGHHDLEHVGVGGGGERAVEGQRQVVGRRAGRGSGRPRCAGSSGRPRSPTVRNCRPRVERASNAVDILFVSTWFTASRPLRNRCIQVVAQPPVPSRLKISGRATRPVPRRSDFIRAVRGSKGWPCCSPSRSTNPKNDPAALGDRQSTGSRSLAAGAEVEFVGVSSRRGDEVTIDVGSTAGSARQRREPSCAGERHPRSAGRRTGGGTRD